MSVEKSAKTRFATALILLLLLATGWIVGVAVDRRIWGMDGRGGGPRAAERADEAGEDAEAPEEGERSSSRRRGLIVEQVGLSDEQHEQVDSIVAHYRYQMRELESELEEELRGAYQPRYRELLEQTRDEIRAVLTPEQQMAYDSLLVEYDRRREERRRQSANPDSGGRDPRSETNGRGSGSSPRG